MMCFWGDRTKEGLSVKLFFNAAAKKKSAMAVEVEESVEGGRWMELILAKMMIR